MVLHSECRLLSHNICLTDFAEGNSQVNGKTVYSMKYQTIQSMNVNAPPTFIRLNGR
jgi:hypothetical protein